MHNDNSIEDRIIDIKSMLNKKTKIELQTIFKEEIYGKDWHKAESLELGLRLEKFDVKADDM